MRLLIACPNCQRQYDATGREVGARFRCHCGTVVTVEQPQGHDAAVVRCSACGAPRSERSTSCRFCEADFTLHERDLHTVCPKCLARISDRARFCRHCGVRLMAELLAGDESDLTCPACGDEYRLTSRNIGEVAVLECGRCAGLWLGNEAFEHLAERAVDAARNLEVDLKRSADTTAQDEARHDSAWQYRSCPVCGTMMNRRNYGRQSGVVVDVCKDHGIWFDAEELPRILAWLRSGGQAKAKRRRAEQAKREERADKAKRTTRRIQSGRELFAGMGELDDVPTVFDLLADAFTWITKR